MFANLGLPDEPGRPLPAYWWARAATFATGYAVSVLASTWIAAWVYSGLSGKRFPSGFLPAGCLYLFALWLLPFLYCHLLSGVNELWRQRVVERRIRHGYLLAAGATSGLLVGMGNFAFAVLPSHSIWDAGTIVLFVGGSFFGICWLVWPRAAADQDYDDLMTPEARAPDISSEIELANLAATESFGRRLGGLLFPNAVVALVGPLGAGKTQLSRAIAEGLGIANPAAVTSPTFTLIHEYPARLPIYHFDAYRLNGPNEFLDLGVTEYFEAGGVCLIEWADKVESALPAERLTIRIEVVDENRRKVELIPAGERYKSLTASVR
jgi:tRNA threonylcarbamoyladenosine biosynthesis protein TsaE